MNRKKRIENILILNFSEWVIDVIDNSRDHIGHNNFDGNEETHFKIILKPNIKVIERKIDIHRKINDLLKNEFENGLHALEIKIIY